MRCGAVAAVVVLLTVALAGCAGGHSDLSEARSIPPAASFEVNFRMEAGDRVEWRWNATGTLHFDMHSHFDGEVQSHRQTNGTAGLGEFQAERAGIHSLWWQNPGATTLGLEFALAGEFVLDSFHPA